MSGDTYDKLISRLKDFRVRNSDLATTLRKVADMLPEHSKEYLRMANAYEDTNDKLALIIKGKNWEYEDRD
jgi:hypothetical protein